MKKIFLSSFIISFLSFLIFSEVAEARLDVPDFNQVYTVDFNSPDYQAQILWNDPQIMTITHENSGCYEGNCVKFRLHDFFGEDSAGISGIYWPPTDRINIGFLVKYGPAYESALDREGYKMMVVHETFENVNEWQPNTNYLLGDMVRAPDGQYSWLHYVARQAGVSGLSQPEWGTERNNPFSDGSVIWDVRTLIRPMIMDRPIDSVSGYFRTVQSCNIAGGVCHDEFGDQYPRTDGSHTFQIRENIGEWIWMEFEIVRGGYNTLYISTRDGSLNGVDPYAVIENTNLLPLRNINEISYWEGASNTNEGSYIMYDDIKIHNRFIGPPPDFFLGHPDTIAPSAPEGLNID